MSKTTEAAATAPGPSSGRVRGMTRARTTRMASAWRLAPGVLGPALFTALIAWTSLSAIAPARAAEAAPGGPTTSKPTAASTARANESRDTLTRLPSATALRPSGPVSITARRAELVQGDSAVYVGNVHLDSNTLHMDGDRLELKQHANGGYEAKITGSPGHMSHPGTGPDDPALSAHAKTLIYNSSTGGIDLIGDALFKRGDDQVTAETIHYELNEKRIQANGGDTGDGQVHFILQAPPAAGATAASPTATNPSESAPAPAATSLPSTPAAEAPKQAAPAASAPAATPPQP